MWSILIVNCLILLLLQPVLGGIDDEIIEKPEENPIGSKQRPSTALCSTRPENNKGYPDPYWVTTRDSDEQNKFPVRCNGTWTCLLLEHDEKSIQMNLFVELKEGSWLSQLGFDIDRLFEQAITDEQMQFLKAHSKRVKQVIRMYFMRHYPGTMLVNVKLLSATDAVFDDMPTRSSPMHLSIIERGLTPVYRSIWQFADIMVEDLTRRLPVADLLVESNHDDTFKLGVQLRELCFA